MARLFLTRWLFSPLQGVLFTDWLRLLAAHRFAVGPRFWPRALLTTASSVSTSLAVRRERRLYGDRIDAVKLAQPPLFILGHYRSGTTHLHNLIARDPRFGFANNFQATFPHTFLTTEATGSVLGSLFAIRKRPHDNVRLDLAQPAEEELALCAQTQLSPHLAWHFPRSGLEREQRYLTFGAASDEERRRWVDALHRVAKKLTLKSGRRLVFKSPLHTARIPLLLAAFPDARFVHLHRNPTRVFQSTRHMELEVVPLFRYQEWPRFGERPDHLDERILRRYRAMFEAYLEDRSDVPSGRLVEIAYRDLDRDPLATLERVYGELGLPDFAPARPGIEKYVESLSGYQKNVYPPLEQSIVERLREEWRPLYEEWGYPLP